MAFTFTSSTVSVGDTTKKSDYDNLLNNTQHNWEILRDFTSTSHSWTGTQTHLSSTVFTYPPDFWGDQGAGVLVQEILADRTSSVCIVKRVVLRTGAWNMSGASQIYVTSTGLAGMFPISMSVVVRDDDGGDYFNFFAGSAAYPHTSSTIIWVSGTTRFSLLRGDKFANSAFNSTAFNRGYISVDYIQ